MIKIGLLFLDKLFNPAPFTATAIISYFLLPFLLLVELKSMLNCGSLEVWFAKIVVPLSSITSKLYDAILLSLSFALKEMPNLDLFPAEQL